MTPLDRVPARARALLDRVPGWPLVFLGANALALAWTAYAAAQPWVGELADPVAVSLARRWLPFALA
ncbi:MAG: hypothetical protein ACRDF0_01425, partial [Candidatus Limnocylindria bacterium]